MNSLRKKALSLFLLIVPALVICCASDGSPASTALANNYIAFVGTYTDGTSKGIYAFRFDATTGTATPLGLAGATENPSFLALDASGTHLYVVNEISNFKGTKNGSVSAFTVKAQEHSLTLINQVSSEGSSPAYISLDRTGKYALVANYGGGNIAVLPISPDGSLAKAVSVQQHSGSGPNALRQQTAHAHSINASGNNSYVLAADLGIDKVMIYAFNAANGKLTPNAIAAVAPGAGPRHTAFGAGDRFLYVSNELASTVTAFAWDSTTGRATEVQTISTLPAGWSGSNTAAEIRVSPNGKFLYVSNRGRDSIAQFSIDATTGKLTYVKEVMTGGQVPRFFCFDATGKWLWVANQNSANINVFSVDATTGKLTRSATMLSIDKPVTVVFVKE